MDGIGSTDLSEEGQSSLTFLLIIIYFIILLIHRILTSIKYCKLEVEVLQ